MLELLLLISTQETTVKTSQQNNYTDAQVLDQLLAKDGTRTDRARYRLVDPVSGQEFRDITSVIAGSCEVSHGALDEIHKQIKFTLYDDPLPLASYLTTVVTDSPLVYLRLNETSGTTATDFSGNGRNGSYNGTAGTDYDLARVSLLTDDGTDLAANFKGTANGFVSVSHASVFNATKFTLECMVQTINSSAGELMYRNDGSGYSFRLRMETGGTLSLALTWTAGGGTTTFTNSNVKINDGRVHHIRAVYDQVKVKIYVDYATIVDTAETRTLNSITAALTIGKSFTGVIDEAAMYASALNFAQCRLHYQAAIKDYNQINFGTDQIRPYYATLMSQPPRIGYGEWETAGAVEGWTTANVSSAVVADGKYKGTSSSNDPQLFGPTLSGVVSGQRFRYIEVGMSVAGSNLAGTTTLEIFFGTTAATSYSSARTTTATVNTNGVFKVYRLDMHAASAGADQWRNGNINSIRVDPCTASTLDFQVDYVRLCGADAEYVEWAMGTFVMTTPDRQRNEGGNQFEVTGYDRTVVLIDAAFTDRYTVSAGTNYVTAIKTILTDAGITVTNIVATTKTLPVAMDWPMGTTRLRAINDLLSAINYYAITFDEYGTAVSKPYENISTRAIDFTYYVTTTPVNSTQYSVALPKRVYKDDFWKTPNRVTLYTGSVDAANLTSTASNYSLSSKASIPNRGNRIIPLIEQADAADQTTLDALATRRLETLSQITVKSEFSTLPIPIHQHLDKIRIVDDVMGVEADFIEHGWTMKLDSSGEMTHLLSSTESIT